MKRYLGMNIMRGPLLGLSLIAAACGGEKSVASKSAEAYREAQAKGIPVGGGQGATETGASVDHSAHGAATDPHAGMDHGATASGAMDHSAHGGAATVDHAAMGHGTTSRTTAADHAAMGHGSSSTNAHAGHTASPRTGGAAHDQHAGMQHTGPPTAADPHAQHGSQPATAPVDHSQHSAMQTPASAEGADAHAQHGVAVAPVPAVAPAPRSSLEMQRVQPAATLRRDAFDAPAPISVSEAAKAARGGGHEGHQTRGITPGQDHENPPTPMPATRDGSNPPPAPDHSQHGAPQPPPSKKNQ